MSDPNLLPATIDYGSDAGAGFENDRPEDIQIPFLTLLQDLSPQVTGVEGKGVEGARAGKMLNAGTGELLGDTIFFVPSHFEHVFCEYTPRDKGGGFLGRYLPEDPIVRKALAAAGGSRFARLKTQDGNELVETYYLFGVMVRGEDGFQPLVIAFSSTKVSVFRRWRSAVKMDTASAKVQAPIFAHFLKVSTVRQKNRKGSFFNFVIAPVKGSIGDSLLPPTDSKFRAAREIGKLVAAGKAQAAEEAAEPEGAERSEVF